MMRHPYRSSHGGRQPPGKFRCWMRALHRTRCLAAELVLWTFVCSQPALSAPESPPPFQPEKALPPDTLFFVSAREWPAARELVGATPYGRLWSDPSLRLFREKFRGGFEESITKPIERELDIRLDDYRSLLRRSVTLALISHRAAESAATNAGWVVLIDTGDKSAECRRKLSSARKKWTTSGKPVRTEHLDGFEFTVLRLGADTALSQLRRLLPGQLDLLAPGIELPFASSNDPCLWMGLVHQVLVLGALPATIHKVLPGIAAGASLILSNQPGLGPCDQTLFHGAPVYGWMSAKPFLDAYATRQPGTNALDRAKLIRASGLGAVGAAGFAARTNTHGFQIELLLNSGPSERRGLVRLLAGDPGEVAVPPFIPADALQFQRWRINGSNAWATFQAMMSEISPQWTSTIDFIIDTANQAARLSDASFDLRANLLGNLGDDFVQYSKAPPPAGSAPDGPSIWILQSPQPEQFTAALQRALIFLSPEAETPSQRDFLGRKIYTVPLPSVPLPFESAASVTPGRALHYSASGGYVALTTKPALLDEFLQAVETNNPARSLMNTPGIQQAAAFVAEPSASLFLYENQKETMRSWYEAARSGGADTNKPTPMSLSLPAALAPDAPASEWFDFALLPPFEKIENHLGILTRASRPSADGIRTIWLMPARAKPGK